MNGRERILATIDGTADHLAFMPITMMFAADQAGVKYLDYATDYRVLAAAQVRVAEKFGFDHVSAISDPAREAADLGAVLQWFEDQPPAIVESRALLADKSRLAHMPIPNPHAGTRMFDRIRAVERLASAVGEEKIVEGWVEGPCAMAADLRGLNTLMLDFYDDPPFVTDLFEFVTAMELRFADAQRKAGAVLMGVGDAAASLVGPKIYRDFVLPFERKLIDGLRQMGLRVRLHICGNTRKILAGMGSLEADIVDLDFLAPLAEARKEMGAKQVLLGNIDPVRCLRDGTPASIEAELARCHFQAGAKYIVGAGCEVPRGTPDENVRAMADYALLHSQAAI